MTNTEIPGVSEALDPQTSTSASEGAEPAKRQRRRAPGLEGMVLAELQQLAGGLGITGTGRMRKGQLIESIKAAQSGGSAPAGTTEPATAPGNGAASADDRPAARPERRRAQRAQAAPESAEKAPVDAATEQRSAAEAAVSDTDAPADRDRRDQRREGGERREGERRDGDRRQDGDRQRDRRQDNRRQDESGDRRQEGRQDDRRDGRQDDGEGNDRRSDDRRPNDNRNNDNRDDDGNRRRRRRDRRGNRDRDRDRGPDRDRRPARERDRDQEPTVSDDDILIPVAGILDILDNYAFVRTSGYLPGPNDVYVSLAMTRRYGLRKGDAVTGAVRQPREGEKQQKFNALVRVDTINGADPEVAKHRSEFAKLTPLYPQDRLRLETEPGILATRIIDLVAPIGKGQRGLIVSPPKAGKTLI
ncbi:MAG TPA: Rho termination factor N-terminal domain-containing protein, partial [Jiangellaceae bacterium]